MVLQGVLPMDIESTSAVMDSRAVEWAIILSRPCIEPCLSSRLVWNPRPPPPVPVELLSPEDLKEYDLLLICTSIWQSIQKTGGAMNQGILVNHFIAMNSKMTI